MPDIDTEAVEDLFPRVKEVRGRQTGNPDSGMTLESLMPRVKNQEIAPRLTAVQNMFSN